MDPALIERIETNIERIASALLAGAVGYAVHSLLSAGLSRLQLGGVAGTAAMLTYLLCSRVLGTITPRKPRFAVPAFEISQIATGELLLTEADRLAPDDELLLTDRLASDELVLTDVDRLEPASVQPEPLVLDDILAEIGPDSRVVRLFDRKAMPTPGQLKSRIDSHLEQEASQSDASDASQALSDALAQLRRSLR
jgi:hypothetical protein